MKTASKILMLIGAIFSCVLPAFYLITSIILLAFADPRFKNDIIEGLKNENINSSFTGSYEQVAEAIQLMFLIIGILLLVVMMFCIANAVLAFIARNKENKALFILNIIFGILSGIYVNSVGAIFGLIVVSKNNKIPEKIEVDATQQIEESDTSNKPE